MTTHVELRRGAYHDSVSLMQVSRTVAGTPGVAAAQVAMATELNVDVLRGMGFDVPDEAGAERPRRGHPRPTTPTGWTPAWRRSPTPWPRCVAPAARAAAVTTRSPRAPSGRRAARSGAEPRASISVPGQHAVAEAFDAIASGLSVMLFSDNVSVDDEVRLKDAAAAADVLVMGPDCGTAHVGGVALGFANVVRPGLGRHRRGLGHRRPAGDVPARRRRGRPQPLPRGRRPRPHGRRRRPLHPAGARRARRRPGHRDRARGVQAPGRRGARRPRGVCRRARPARCTGRCSAPGRPDLTAAVEAVLAAEGHAVPTWPATASRPPTTRRWPPGPRCAACSAAAPWPTRR